MMGSHQPSPRVAPVAMMAHPDAERARVSIESDSSPDLRGIVNDSSETRSLPSRDVDAANIENRYVQFIFYCNPSIPSSKDTTELRKGFQSLPRTDGKTFQIFTLFELVRKLEEKEIETWSQLVVVMGVEPPDISKNQSTQKVQQYAVRLKVWQSSGADIRACLADTGYPEMASCVSYRCILPVPPGKAQLLLHRDTHTFTHCLYDDSRWRSTGRRPRGSRSPSRMAPQTRSTEARARRRRPCAQRQALRARLLSRGRSDAILTALRHLVSSECLPLGSTVQSERPLGRRATSHTPSPSGPERCASSPPRHTAPAAASPSRCRSPHVLGRPSRRHHPLSAVRHRRSAAPVRLHAASRRPTLGAGSAVGTPSLPLLAPPTQAPRSLRVGRLAAFRQHKRQASRSPTHESIRAGRALLDLSFASHRARPGGPGH